MKNLLRGLLLLLLCLTGAPRASAAVDATAGTVPPKPLAILIYADWCYNCKMITPRLQPLEEEYADRIVFDRLDVTSEQTKAGAREKAKALGILPLYFANKGTGLVMLIDRQREKVGELRYTLSDEQMRAQLDALLAR